VPRNQPTVIKEEQKDGSASGLPAEELTMPDEERGTVVCSLSAIELMQRRDELILTDSGTARVANHRKSHGVQSSVELYQKQRTTSSSSSFNFYLFIKIKLLQLTVAD